MLFLPALVRGQITLTTLVNFNTTNGANPYGGLTLGPDGNFYGTTESGGDGGVGTVYRADTNGNLTTLVNFYSTNGANPYAGLTLGSDGNLYGTTESGGSDSSGTVFQITTNGALTTLFKFSSSVVGANPYGELTVGPNGNLYGTTSAGGSGDSGTVFTITTNGILTTLVQFNLNTGRFPYGGVVFGPDGNLYGVTEQGGSGSGGTVFRATTNGTLTTLVNFITYEYGGDPYGGLTLGPDGNLYGTTKYSSGAGGMVFKMTTNGTLTTLANFNDYYSTNPTLPEAALTFGPDGNVYGTTFLGGHGSGTMFRVTTNGTLTILANFNNGSHPAGSLTLGPDGNFYGTTVYGGNNNEGTIYRLNLGPEIITNPVNQSVPIGGVATFIPSDFGTGPFNYQWSFNGALLAGATNQQLNLSPLMTNQAGFYQLVITNDYGSATSQLAQLTVLLQPNNYNIVVDGSGNTVLYLAGAPGSTNRLWATMDATLPLAQWHEIATNVMDTNGFSQFVDTNTAGIAAKYYRLSAP